MPCVHAKLLVTSHRNNYIVRCNVKAEQRGHSGIKSFWILKHRTISIIRILNRSELRIYWVRTQWECRQQLQARGVTTRFTKTLKRRIKTCINSIALSCPGCPMPIIYCTMWMPTKASQRRSGGGGVGGGGRGWGGSGDELCSLHTVLVVVCKQLHISSWPLSLFVHVGLHSSVRFCY